MDEISYAKKMVLLPAGKKARERARREVMVHARLCNVNVVRYHDVRLSSPSPQERDWGAFLDMEVIVVWLHNPPPGCANHPP